MNPSTRFRPAAAALLLWCCWNAPLPAQNSEGGGIPAAPRCVCSCGGDTFVVDAAQREQCVGLSGSGCLSQQGVRGQLAGCDYLFVSAPRAAVAVPPAPPSSPAPAAPAPAAPAPMAAAAGATGDSLCQDDSWADCEDRLLGVAKVEADSAATASASAAESEQRQNLALGSSSPSGASVKNDFLQRFLAALDIPGLTDNDGLLSFRYNPPGGVFSFAAAASKPELFGPLEQAIPAAERAARAAELEEKLGNFDDIGFTLGINLKPANTRLGRAAEIDQYFVALSQQAASAFESEDAAEIAARKEYRLALVAKNIKLDSKAAAAGPDRAELEGLLQKVVDASVASDTAYAQAMGDAGIFQFSDLVANQPQFTLAIEGRNRDQLVGPDDLEANLALEVGVGANFNLLKRECAVAELACYQKFLATHRRLAEKKWRFKLQAAYQETDAYDSPISGVVLHLDQAQSLSASASFGGVLSFRQDAQGMTIEQNKFVLEASYEDVKGDDQRQNRLVATATLTQRVDQDLSLEVSFIWANKPQYRGEVDEELGARAGLRYKFNRPPATD